MSPEPNPSLSFQMDEIINDLRLKMFEEILCVFCFQFLYKLLEWKKCLKLFCKYYQFKIFKGSVCNVESTSDINTFWRFKDMYYHILREKIDLRKRKPKNCRRTKIFRNWWIRYSLSQFFKKKLNSMNQSTNSYIDFCEFSNRYY